jgi:hypothetical protein
MKYFTYLKKNRIVVFLIVIAVMILFYIAGFGMNVDSRTEGLYLIAIIGIPLTIIGVVTLVQWYRNK